MKKYLYTLMLSLIGFSACDSGLDMNPKDQSSDPLFWKTPNDFQSAANDFYFSLQTVAQFIDRNSDVAFGDGQKDISISNGSYLIEANDTEWDEPYAYIRSTNYLLGKANESGLGTEIDRWVGEAHFFRAYNYWKLVRKFGGVPKITIVLDTSSPELYTPRSTQAEIINFIIEDLDEAIAKLPLQSELTDKELGHVTKGAAQALKARVALYQGTWAKYRSDVNSGSYFDLAINASNEVIISGEYAVFKGKGADSYKHLFILEGDDCSEVILARRYYSNQYVTHNWTRELWFNAMVPTKNMADIYLDTNGLPISKSTVFEGYQTLNSEFKHRDPRMAMTFVVPGSSIYFEGGVWQTTFPGFVGTNATRTGYMLRKFLGEDLNSTQFRGEYDFKEFRYGEVLLIHAEALFEKNGRISNPELELSINKLRERVSMPNLTNEFVTANGLDMLEEIRRERTVELAFEGYRRDDLRRWKTAETVLPKSLRGIKFVGTEYETKYPDVKPGKDIAVDTDGFIVTDVASSRKFIAPKHYLSPIPSQQVQLSKGTLEQNEGWK